MWLGIDVGGTFTDAVVIDQGQVVAESKTPTIHQHLLEGILSAMDQVLAGLSSEKIERIALSTTIVTNALVAGQLEQVGMVVITGPGMDSTDLLPSACYEIPGYIDHRGREISEPSALEVAKACEKFADCKVFVVSGKFAVRNPAHEHKVAQWLTEVAQPQHISLGSEITGTLNFLRRTNSAYYNAAVWRQFRGFSTSVEMAVRQRGLTAPIYVLKADGGTLPLTVAQEHPVESIFTGPAASVLGIMAISDDKVPAVSLDIGGTTTDIALWKNGVPLFAQRGAKISGYPTAVRSFWLTSVGIGGDSFVRWEADELKIGPMRRGPAMAVGGGEPTVSDAMVVAGLSHFGDRLQAEEAMRRLAMHGETIEEVAKQVLAKAASIIYQAIQDMFDEQAAEPVYRVEHIVHSERFLPELLIGVGGAAQGLAPLVAALLQVPCKVPAGSMVANAIGAAVARPTLAITLRADTAQGYYTVTELGIKNKLPQKSSFGLDEARELAAAHLAERAVHAGIEVSVVETIYEEEFNLVRGFSTVGKIITCSVQSKPGVVMHVKPIVDTEGMV